MGVRAGEHKVRPYELFGFRSCEITVALKAQKRTVWNLKKPPRQKLIAKRYALEKELGRGGGGVVHLVRDRNLNNQKMALKVVPLENLQDPILAAALKNEFATLALLHHPHLAQVNDFGTTDREMYLSSEWVDGEDIVTAAEKTDLNTVFRLCVQTLRAVDFLHRRGVLHLDLKPENILVTTPDKTGELTVKLIDFGLSQWKSGGEEESGDFFGTPPYSAPEILMGGKPSPLSDLYSLGMIFHQIFAGRFPFKTQDPLEILKQQIYTEPIRVEMNPALPDDFAQVLLSMVAREPANRAPSPQEVLNRINKSLGESFSLRDVSAPIRILEESDHFFRSGLLDSLTEAYATSSPRTLLSGASGIGKSRLVQRLKQMLQLKGRRAFWFGDLASLKEFLKTVRDTGGAPLFIDLPELSDEDWDDLIASLERKGHSVLVTTRRSEPKGGSFQWQALDPLKDDEVLGFLKKEMQGFPADLLGVSLLSEVQGSPSRLEALLQSFREERMMQWSEEGWRWTAAAPTEFADLASLLNRRQERWEERLHRIREVLKFSRVGLNAATLEGILNLERGALDEKLEEWSRGGKISAKKSESGILYYAKAEETAFGLKALAEDWGWIEAELKRLYDEGAFETGVEWARLVEAKASQESMPEETSLILARLYAAAGHAAKALETLPSAEPTDPKRRGLFHEVRGRARFALGETQGMEEDLKNAEDFYRTAGELSGLSRALNLQGIVAKKSRDFEKAFDRYQAASEAAAQGKDAYLQGLALMNLGIIHNEQGQIEKAMTAYSQAFLLAKEADHPLLHCLLRHNWVNLLYHMGRAAEAEAACYEWLALAIQHRYLELHAAALNYLALLASLKNHREIQLVYLNQAVALLNPEKNTQHLFQTLMNRGYLNLDMKRPTAAQLDGEAALNLAEKRSLKDLSALARILLGKILRERPRPDFGQSEVFFESALETAHETRNRHLIWSTLYELGLTAKKKKETERARERLLLAKKELQDFLDVMPETMKLSYLRDRKMESILEELETLTNLET